MSESNNHINYSHTDIEKYWKGQLPSGEMHAMEKAALDDPFLAEAMEGYRESIKSGTGTSQDIEDLQQRLSKRVSSSATKVIPIKNNGWWRIAAVVLLAVGGVWWYTTLNNAAEKNSLAKEDKLPPKANDNAAATGKDSLQSVENLAPTADTNKDLALNDNKTVSGRKKINTINAKEDTSTTVSNLNGTVANKPTGIKSDKDNAAITDELAKNNNDIESKRVTTKAAAPVLNNITNNAEKEKSDDEKTVNPKASYYYNTFNGSVVDNSNRPLPNATIKIPGQQIGTLTDKAGNFSFKTADTLVTVSVASVGYQPTKITLRNPNDPLSNHIILQPKESALNEVVVSGYGNRKKAAEASKDLPVKALEAEPSVGWNEYNAYLSKNKRVSNDNKNTHGDVVVTFDVYEKGKMRNFRIEKSLDDDLDEEAIRLVKEGPAWRLLTGKKAKASVTVTF